VAYGECEPWLDSVIDYLDQQRKDLANLVSARLPGVNYAKPDAGYFGWLDLRGVLHDNRIDGIADQMIERGKIAVAPGALYGPSGRGFIRINFATSGEILVEAIDRIAKALAEI
jgi:cystathionine beta-lyase